MGEFQKRYDWRGVLALLLLLATAAVARAQIGVIQGTVRDNTGAVLPGVQVDLRRNGQVIRSSTTGASGEFSIPVDFEGGGSYDLHVSLLGFSTAAVSVSREGGSIQTRTSAFSVEGFVSLAQGAPPPPPPPPPPPEAAPPPTPLPAPSAPEPVLDPYVVPVFYATDRARLATQPLDYGGDRNPSSMLHLGRLDVRVPRDHRMGAIERPSIWTLWREDPNKTMMIVSRMELTYDDFYGSVAGVVGRSTAKQALVFIHGFNVGFEDAVFRTAQISYDLGFEGATVLYSWPSVRRTADYRIDERNNEWTVSHLRWFLEDLRKKTGATTIHLIAHSMGNRALAAALKDMTPSTGNQARFSQVVLTAPDIDVGLFPELAAALKRMAQRVTVYASDRDIALQAAREYDTFQRVGSTVPNIVIVDGIDTIDASAVDTSFVGHSYVGDSTKVLSDLFYVLRGVTAGARAAIRGEGQPPRQWWAFRR